VKRVPEELLEPEAEEEEVGAGEQAVAPAGDGESSVAKRIDADAILDTLMPPSVDWRGTVRRHPLASVATVALVGYLVGRTKGAAIVSGVTAGLSAALVRQLSDVFDGDFFEF
jgi:hypothetical protein